MQKELEELAKERKIEQKSKPTQSFSSPTSAVSLEETRILSEYIDQQNLFKIISQEKSLRKPLTLKKFFKMKRNQEVVISSVIEKDVTVKTEGKVAAIGRDFVMVTNLQNRIWIPYIAIESATIPFGFPTYSNPHQHHIYDNQLQQKLMLKFGETVAKKEELVRQFFEETLRTNLHSWREMWVEVKTAEKIFFGKITESTKDELILQLFKKNIKIPFNDIRYVSTVGLFPLWKKILKLMFDSSNK
ncbi:hypothetical protein [Cytobacillus dafuensis]|uniref:Uncharacterized protein n=1 Tax=Cytobacillus dafuensis TaxID=1742359 RepID=A0A5B8YZT0_CYTDA|nr:hypothetical protein [Cytobacillus dafuensis]QED46200.1 hypothetical protein FSZ17_02280 [Cytobacillus dafuensis]